MTYFEDEKEGNGWEGDIGSGTTAGSQSIMLYEDGTVHIEAKNEGGDYTTLTVEIYKVNS